MVRGLGRDGLYSVFETGKACLVSGGWGVYLFWIRKGEGRVSSSESSISSTLLRDCIGGG